MGVNPFYILNFEAKDMLYELVYNLDLPKTVRFEADNESELLDEVLAILQREEGNVFSAMQKIDPLVRNLESRSRYKLNVLGTAFVRISE